jgi:protein SCO1/2
MKSRREFLTLGANALPALALTACASTAPLGLALTPTQQLATNGSCRKPGGASAKYFPSLVVLTHEGRKAWFYDDLIKGKIVGINFMSVREEEKTPVTANLVQVQDLLGDRLGRDVFLISVTTDPEHDTPAVLEAFAKKHGVKKGWLFVTGKEAELSRLAHHMGTHGHGNAGSHRSFRYGNEPYGRWATFHAMAKPEQIALRFDRVTVRENPSSPNA